MTIVLIIICLLFISWLVVFSFFAFTDEDDESDTPDWDRICKIAMSEPTKEQKEKVEILHKKFLKAHHINREE